MLMTSYRVLEKNRSHFKSMRWYFFHTFPYFTDEISAKYCKRHNVIVCCVCDGGALWAEALHKRHACIRIWPMIYRVAQNLLRSHETPGTGLPEQLNLFSTTEHIQFTFCIFIDRYIIYKTRGRPARLPRVFRNRNLKIADDSFLAPAHWGSEPILTLPAVSPILWQSNLLSLDRYHFKISIERVTTLIWLKAYIHF